MKTRIRQLRAQANLTQVQLGKTIGVAGKTISMWELGVSEPSNEQLIKLATFFDVSLKYLKCQKDRLYEIVNLDAQVVEAFVINDFEKTLEIAKSLTRPGIANDTQVWDIVISCYENGTADNVWPGESHIWTKGLDDLLSIKGRDDETS